MIKKVILILTIVMFASFITAGAIFASTNGLEVINESDYEINKEVVYENLNGINEININSVSVDINFILTETEEFKVDFKGKASGMFFKYEHDLKSTKTEDTINVEFVYSNWGFLTFYTYSKATVYLPKTYNKDLIVKSVSGDIKVANLDLTKAEFKSVSGEITLDSIITKDGSINTTSGDVTATNMSGKYVINTVSGDVEFKTNSDDFDLNIKTISGDVELTNINNCSITINTISGDLPIFANFDGTQKSRFIEGRLGTEAINKLVINTTSGDVDVD